MIVVDANVVIYWATEGPRADDVEKLIAIDSDWRTVPLWRYECANALVQMIRARLISMAAALKAITKAEAFLTDRELAVSADRVMQTAIRYGISGYDAQYIALAEEFGLKCVTADISLARKTPGISVLLSDIH